MGCSKTVVLNPRRSKRPPHPPPRGHVAAIGAQVTCHDCGGCRQHLGSRPSKLVDTPQRTGQPPATQNDPVQMSTVPKMRISGLEKLEKMEKGGNEWRALPTYVQLVFSHLRNNTATLVFFDADSPLLITLYYS